MALFIDGMLNSLLELQSYENRILDVASTENIDVTGKARIAKERLASELRLFLRRNSPSDSFWALTARVNVDDVVVSDPMKRWHAYETLSLIYQDAYNNQLNDRYLGKWKEYAQLAKGALLTLFEVGIGIVRNPAPKASGPALIVGGGTGGGTGYYLSVAWVNGTGEEGQPSDVQQAFSDGTTAMQVTVANPPKNVTGWNLYAGASPDTLALQNAVPMGLSEIWSEPTTGLSSGRRPSYGQEPDCWIIDRRAIARG